MGQHYHVSSLLLLAFLNLFFIHGNITGAAARHLLETPVPEIPKPKLPKVPSLPKLEIPTLPKPELPTIPKPEIPAVPKPQLPTVL
ncbi:hypothetical protein EJD97_002564, partial [Solanum chilense]